MHEIDTKGPPPEDHDDNPHWDSHIVARARPASEVLSADAVEALRFPRGRPKLSPSKRRKLVSVRLPVELVERIDASGHTRTEIIERAIRATLHEQTATSERAESRIKARGD